VRYVRIPVGAFATNCVILEDETSHEGIVIDPGADADVLRERVRKLGMTVKRIVLTHGHLDHCLAAPALAREWKAPVAMHEADVPLYRNLPVQSRMLLGGLVAGAEDDPGDPGALLRDGDKVRFGAVEGTVMHLPGHSPGGIGLLFDGTPGGTPGVLCCGDTIFRDGVGRVDLWGGDWDTLLRSIRGRIFTLPQDTKLVTGHGAETTVGREKANFPF